MPASALAVLEFDTGALCRTGTGKKLVDRLVKKDDCLYPLVSEKVEKILIGYESGRDPTQKILPFGLILCSRCSVDALAGCMARDFSLLFDRDSVFNHGGFEFIQADGDPPVCLAELGRQVFFVGRKSDAREVADVAGRHKRAMAGSKRLVHLFESCPGAPVARLAVLKGEAFKNRVIGSGNVFVKDVPHVPEAVFSLNISQGTTELAGRMYMDSKAGISPLSLASSLNSKIGVTSANPIIKRLGLSGFLGRVKFTGHEQGWVSVSFSIKEKELFDFLESRGDLLSISL